MLGAYMDNPVPSSSSSQEDGGIEETKSSKKSRHTVNLRSEVYSKLGEYIAIHGNTKENVVNDAVLQAVSMRGQFLKMFAPHLALEHSTQNAIYISDSQLDKTAVIKAKWNDIEKDNSRSLLSLKCELCDSESCIHVRYSLVLPDIYRLQKEGKLV